MIFGKITLSIDLLLLFHFKFINLSKTSYDAYFSALFTTRKSFLWSRDGFLGIFC